MLHLIKSIAEYNLLKVNLKIQTIFLLVSNNKRKVTFKEFGY